MFENRRDESGGALAFERLPAGQHFVDERTKRKDVGARVRLFAFELLGRHVLQRADDRAAYRQIRWRGWQRRLTADGHRRALRLGDAEVQQLGAGARQHHVSRLQVSVNHTGTMRRVQRASDLNRNGERLVERQTSGAVRREPRQPRRQRLAFEILHDEIGHAVLLTNVVQRADVWVIELADGAGLAIEAGPELGIGGE